MDTRREFLKKTSLLAGMAMSSSLLPASIQKALAIDPEAGSTWQDAEHVVILMQENRSFDHAFGSLQGVRGFNDPRAIRLPNGNPVWLQTDSEGRSYLPFRLDIKNTKATWMESLPHNWNNQVGARNDGRMDQWLEQKQSRVDAYAHMPLTMGHYTREDIPFYYAMADAFTICDQNFCSSLTGTTPNRLFFWTGTIRAEQHENSRALVWNEDAEYEKLFWKTFPERLEEERISWKIYQNELSVAVGFEGEEEAWLANFGDNPLEFFRQYAVRQHAPHMVYLKSRLDKLPAEWKGLERAVENLPATDPARKDLQKKIRAKKTEADHIKKVLEWLDQKKFEDGTEHEKNIHRNAFVTNQGDPDFHSLEEIRYDDAGTERKMKLPKGDLLHQFREDVHTGRLPAVSWLVPPENLSDHPASAWYGAWYISEVMDILTSNAEIWRKTIFILTYDENDGYFDHVPPFVAPNTADPETGSASQGMDTRVDYITRQQEKERNGFPVPSDRESPIGLGYRVPMIIASPWSRGGFVNSEVFDHTSTIRFLERFLSLRSGRHINETNISDWRRTVCGNLTSAFHNADEPKPLSMEFVKRNPFAESIYNAKFKNLPATYTALQKSDIEQFSRDPYTSAFMPVQEKGIRPSNGLHYELYADGVLNPDQKTFDIRFESGKKLFGESALGAPFNVYARGKFKKDGEEKDMRTWAIAVKPGSEVNRSWPLASFTNGMYALDVHGPNGFLRAYLGSADDPAIKVTCEYQLLKSSVDIVYGNIEFKFENRSGRQIKLALTDNAYGRPEERIVLAGRGTTSIRNFPIHLSSSFGWYDFTIRAEGYAKYARRFAGRAETGQNGFTDPFMGRTI